MSKTKPKDKSKPAGRIRVRARRMGYFGHQRRRPGDVFDIPAAMFTDDPDCWFEKAEPKAAVTEPGSLSFVERSLRQSQAQREQDFAQPDTAEHEGSDDEVL